MKKSPRFDLSKASDVQTYKRGIIQGHIVVLDNLSTLLRAVGHVSHNPGTEKILEALNLFVLDTEKTIEQQMRKLA